MSGPAWLRRLRALTRPPRRIEGFVDGCVAGEIRGWALKPAEPGRRVHVVALCEGRVVAEALADLSRMDLIQDGRGDGRHGFRLKLPPGLADGGAKTVRVEAVAGGALERLLRGEIEIAPPEPVASEPRPAPAGAETVQAQSFATAQGRAVLAIWGDDEEAVRRTEASWAAQDWPDRDLVRIAPGADAGRAREVVSDAHTVILVRAGDTLDPAAARLLVQARPLADVVTWDGRPEAQALGVLLGESLGGAFAVRGHVLAGRDLPAGGLRALELRLANRLELRWAHLAAPLTIRAAAPLQSPDDPPARQVPARLAQRITLAAWPAGGADAHASLLALLAQAPDAEIEILTLPEDLEPLRERIGPAANLSIRPVDAPPTGGAGAWLRALSEAASGEAVVLTRAGVYLEAQARGLEELAAWSLHPLAGAASVTLRTPGQAPLSGLGLAREDGRWRIGSAYGPAQDGRGGPVLAAPAAFMVVSRAKLAAVGGIDDLRFPGHGADLDLGLRLRRAGWTSLVLGGLSASWSGDAGTPEAAGLAPFDPAVLAAAALAFPAGGTP